MARIQPSYRQLPALLLAIALVAMAFWSYVNRLEWAEMFALEGGQAENFGGNDWVTWQDTDEGVVAAAVHPLIKGNPELYAQFFKEGDILRRIEYDSPQDIYRKEVVDGLAQHTAPGTVVLYWYERPGTSQPGNGWGSLLITHSFRPSFTFVDQPWLWYFSPWVLIAGNFIAIITLLIIYPIVRKALRESWSIALVVVMAFLVFGVMGIHHLNLLVSSSYSDARLEQYFTFLIALLIPLYGVSTIVARLSKRLRWLTLILLGLVGWASYVMAGRIFGGSYYLFAETTEAFVLTLFTSMVLMMLLLSFFQMWSGRSRLDKTFHLLAFVYIAPLFLMYQFNLLGWKVGPPVTEFTDLLCYGAIFIPLINAAAAQLKFGRVSLVLTATLQYVVLSALVLLLYYILHLSLESFGLGIKYQAYLELALVIVLVFILRAVYKFYEPRVRRYFVLAQQSRRDKLEKFISTISQYPSSHKLLEDLVVAIREYYDTPQVGIRIKGDPDCGDKIDLEESEFSHVYQYLKENGVVWARNRQITTHKFSTEVESVLLKLPYALGVQITVNEQIYGMIMVGRKRRGVFNIDDQDLLLRIVQQTRLTLGVLHLLEREKLLLQKNFEANLTALRSQINPHFLFNTLNTISALIHDDPDDAEKAVEKLAFIFRYTLKNSDKATVTLKEELSLVRTYLDIEKIRFGERLQLHFEIDEALLEVSLPAFVIQTVIENCIKHGIAKIIGKGMVSIKVASEGDLVRCVIEDNGPGIDMNRIHASTGLSNTHTRMEQIYGRTDLLKFENTGSGTRVTVWLPKAGSPH